MSRALPAVDSEDLKCIETIMWEWFVVNGLLGDLPNEERREHDAISLRRMIVRLRIDYPRIGELRDGSLAMVFCRILFGNHPPPATTTEALQRRVATPPGAFAQLERRQELQAEADRLASLGQLTPVIWHDDAALSVTFVVAPDLDFGSPEVGDALRCG